MRVTLTIASLSAGGAERVISTMANHWAAEGAEVTVLTLSAVQSDFYRLHPSVHRVAVGGAGTSRQWLDRIWSNLRRVSRVRAAIRTSSPDVVVSFVDTMNVLVLLACAGLDAPVIVSERTDPTQHDIGRPWTLLRNWLYPRADAVVVQSAAVRFWAERFVRARRVYVVPNPVSVPDVDQTLMVDEGKARGGGFAGRTVVGIGRLVPTKGFDLLIRAFAQVLPDNPGWRLLIAGEGGERPRLEALSDELGVSNEVVLPGTVDEPIRLLRRSDIFVLSSRYEGFPNVLLEAMACGLPVIATDCPSGPRHIVLNQKNGLLVPAEDAAALAAAMQSLIRNADERERLGRQALKVRQRFSLERVMTQWDQIFSEVTSDSLRSGRLDG